jgi:hypothetical protein
VKITCKHREKHETPRCINKTRHKAPNRGTTHSPSSLAVVLTRPLISLLSPHATGGCIAAGRSQTTATVTEERAIEAFIEQAYIDIGKDAFSLVQAAWQGQQ